MPASQDKMQDSEVGKVQNNHIQVIRKVRRRVKVISSSNYVHSQLTMLMINLYEIKIMVKKCVELLKISLEGIRLENIDQYVYLEQIKYI